MSTNLKDAFLNVVTSNQVTVLRGDTGSGKSTNSMSWLVESGFSVVSAQPRIINTFSLAEFCNVDYRNGDSSSKKNSNGCFVTTGILQNMLLDPAFEPDYVAIDECHEFSQAQELCLALIKEKLANGWRTKALIISATLNDDEIAAYFTDLATFHMGGVKYPITEHQINENLILDTIEYHLSKGQRILFFLPGKGDISDWDKLVRQQEWFKLNNYLISQAHSEVSNVYESIKDHGKPELILSTNICAAGITPVNVSVVIDLGVDKQVSETDGIWGLREVNCSNAELDQRKGRTGRNCEGIYYLASNVARDARNKYPTPEIKRTNVQKIELSVRKIGRSCNNLSFIHQPDNVQVNEAISALIKWKLLDEGKLSEIGKQVERLPLDVNLATILIEAKELGCLKLAIEATTVMNIGRFLKCDLSMVTTHKGCDIMASILAYKRFISSSEDRAAYRDQLINKSLYRVRDNITKLTSLFGAVKDHAPEKLNVALSKTMSLFECTGSSSYGHQVISEQGKLMTIERGSVVMPDKGDLLLGIPRTIKPRNGGREFTVLTMCSKLR